MEDLKEDIYQTERNYQRHRELLAQDEILTKRNRELFSDFIDSCLGRGVSKSRCIIYIRHLRNLGRLTERNFDKEGPGNPIDRREMERIMAQINGSGKYAPWSIQIFRVTLKKYYRWLYDLESDDRVPDVVRWIKGRTPPASITREDLLTDEEVTRILDATPNLMYKAMVLTLLEGGLRPGELLQMRIRDVKFLDAAVKIKVRGKTEKQLGERIVPLIRSFGLLHSWIENHPFRDNLDSPVWIVTSHRRRKGAKGTRISASHPVHHPSDGPEDCLYGKVISLAFLEKEISRLAELGGVSPAKRVTPYLFRHTQLTAMRKRFGGNIAKKFGGHAPDSRMDRFYDHLSDDDVFEVMTAKQEEQFLNQKCSSCANHNRPSVR